MWPLVVLFIVFIRYSMIDALSCYQCSMKYSNAECNINNSSYTIECQPTYDTCLTIVLKPAILDEIIITKYCTKRKACERQRAYTHSLTPCLPNDEGRSWGCVSCCGDRDLCNYNHSNRLHSSINSRRWLLLYVVFVLVITNRWQLPVLSPRV